MGRTGDRERSGDGKCDSRVGSVNSRFTEVTQGLRMRWERGSKLSGDQARVGADHGSRIGSIWVCVDLGVDVV